MSVTVNQVKCACSDCVCIVDVEKGGRRDGRIFCGDSCAEHNRGGPGCNHAGCTCHG